MIRTITLSLFAFSFLLQVAVLAMGTPRHPFINICHAVFSVAMFVYIFNRRPGVRL